MFIKLSAVNYSKQLTNVVIKREFFFFFIYVSRISSMDV